MHGFSDFTEAAEAVLAHLQQRLPLGLWMVTRTESDDWIVLDAADRSYGVNKGDVLRWSDSFCSRMTRGDGPNIARDSRKEASYRDAPIAQQMPIACYVGYPLRRRDGTLIGTLCGIDPEPGGEELESAAAEAEILARLLATLLERELDSEAVTRMFRRLHQEAQEDYLTGAHNRRGWEEALQVAEHYCRNVGSPAAVIYVDLDELKPINDRDGHEAGDRLLVDTARTLQQAIRKADYLARVGGDEFGILALECDTVETERLERRVRRALEKAGIKASVGVSTRDPRRGIRAAVREADRLMYEQKSARKG